MPSLVETFVLPPGDRDIVVCVPKSRAAEVAREEEDVARREAAGERGIEYYWQMGRLPRACPRRVYFVEDGAVRSYHEAVRMVPGEGRIYLVTRIHRLPVPIPMGSFRGFRYFKEGT